MNRKNESEALPFSMGNDGKEAIVVLGGEFILVSKTGVTIIGKSREETKDKLKSLGKIDNFLDF
jgi:hypothetical protein